MGWRQPADRGVVEAVIATFRAPAERSKLRLSAIRESDWVRSYYWLDASGLALYFSRELETLGVEDAIPDATHKRLRQNLEDNRARVSLMFAEFASINRAFQEEEVDYANLKGFALSPESCPDPALRRALDFDFLVDGGQLDICKEILRDRGYILTAATGKTWEFKAGASERSSMKDFYRGGPQRSVELHFSSSSVSGPGKPVPSRDERLDRLHYRSLGGFIFPALSPCEQFVGQALHLFGHLCGASTRPAWLLEYRNHVRSFYSDQDFWESVKERAGSHRDASIAIGLVSLLSGHLFGGETPPTLDEWTLDCLPAPVRLWAEQYGPRTVLADIPGTKLYLLLLQELRSGEEPQHTRQQMRQHLLPAPRAPRIVYPGLNDSLGVRLGKELVQMRFFLFRLRFHVVEGVRYLIAATQWKRQLLTLRSVAKDKPTFAARNPREAKD